MLPVAVLFATREGQTQKIAEHVAVALRERGHSADVVDVRQPPPAFVLDEYGAAIVAASVHAGHHEREMVQFVTTHRAALEAIPTAFLSVSLSEAGVERAAATPEQRATSERDVHGLLDGFFRETGWHPARVKPVAGAVLYREYGLLKRWMMRMIVKKAGGDIDTSRNYEYTDWQALDDFVAEMAEQLPADRPRPRTEMHSS